ncbi:histidine phosphatase family protein [Duganella qianjiadongensis]|uniref:Phosphoglycerate mutase n=1 Tax=Duganella qianjiadongensis TaxID=2692176 RepID=A0ABW9VSN6_9BURK|nr:histidine phosphatase family protein [Duganella qianjiadongensis]MYM42084.1 phosphoglycerate mutase [Duganella qianjiadongensis]
MRLLLVRHPQPLIEPGICYGSSDLPVSAEQLAQTATALAATLPTSTILYTSPLQRCAQLAQELAERLALAQPVADARLAEIHFGLWELQRWDDISRAEIDAWAADLVHYRPGGGESVLHMAQRVHSFYHEWYARKQEAIVICHAGTIRLLQACHSGLAPAAMAQEAAQRPHNIDHGSTLLLKA